MNAPGTAARVRDPFGFELFKNAVFAIADEMALTVCRTSYSAEPLAKQLRRAAFLPE